MEDDKDILLIAIFTFLTVTMWIFFELLKTSKTVTTPESNNRVIQSIDPKIDLTTLEVLEKRLQP